MPRTSLLFTTLSNILSGLLNDDRTGPIDFIIASLNAYSVRDKTDLFNFIRETALSDCLIKWMVSSDNSLQISASVGVNTLVIPLDRVCEGLQFDKAYRLIRETAVSTGQSLESHLQGMLTGQTLSDSVSKHWLQYTRIGWS